MVSSSPSELSQKDADPVHPSKMSFCQRETVRKELHFATLESPTIGLIRKQSIKP
jgi:hypothetical protein